MHWKKKLEGDKLNLSHAYEMTKSVEKEISENMDFFNKLETKQIKEKLIDRKNFMFHPRQLAANFLDPKLKSERFSVNEVTRINTQ